MNSKIDVRAASYAAAGFSALLMVVITLLNRIGIYSAMADRMEVWHMFYAPTVVGTITGMIEAAIISFIVVYIFSLMYNKLVK